MVGYTAVDPMLHVVITGNPGVGKSTIANTLMGQVVFESGVRVHREMTGVLQTRTVNGVKYSDTPGLDDQWVREKAAREISRAINAATQMKLVFVVTLESGRIRPADVATIDVVLTAIEHVGVDMNGRFSLIVNQCDDGELALLDDVQVTDFVKQRFGGRRTLSHALFLRRWQSLVGKENRLLEDCEKLEDFIREAPDISVDPDVHVQAELYDASQSEAEAELCRLRQQLEALSERPSWLTTLIWVVGLVTFGLGRAAVSAVRAFL